jgi:cyclic pyranopterin phosphate synthase
MPEEGVQLTENSKILTADEIVRIAKVFVDEGVEKIRFTGGEPLVSQLSFKTLHELVGSTLETD